MFKIIEKILPKKNYFVGIDIGTHNTKIAEINIADGFPKVASLRISTSPSDVWTDRLDEEGFVLELQNITQDKIKEVITCIGGDMVINRIQRLPQLPDKEMETAVRLEIEKIVRTPVDQLITRYICLDHVGAPQAKPPGIKLFASRKAQKKQIENSKEEVHNYLLLAVPAATVYQYYGIFSRAGLMVTAFDLQAFALWRLFGRGTSGATALADIGAKTSHLVIMQDGIIRFIRSLPVGSNNITNHLMNTYGVDFSEASKAVKEAAAAVKDSQDISLKKDFIQEGFLEIIKELRRSFEFYSSLEKIKVEKLILSGGTSNTKNLPVFLQKELDIPVEIGFPDIDFKEGQAYNPVFAVAIGLALREVI